MKGYSGKARGINPVVCNETDRSATSHNINTTQKGKHDAKSSSRPTFNVKAMANKKKLALSKGSKRKNNRLNDYPSSSSLGYNAPSTSQQVVVAPKYENMQDECRNQYMTGPMKAVASGQTKIYSTPPNASMAKKKQKKKTIATSMAGKKQTGLSSMSGKKISGLSPMAGKKPACPPIDDSQQILKISDFEPSSQQMVTKSSRNITSLSNVEMHGKGTYDERCDKPTVTGRPKFDPKAQRAKSPRNGFKASTGSQFSKSSTRKNLSEQRITTQANNDYQKITIPKDKARSQTCSIPNSTIRANMMNDCDGPQLITNDSKQAEKKYLLGGKSDHSQLIATSGKMFNPADRQSIKVICQNKSDRVSVSSMTGATSSQAINKEKVFYQEPREIQGLETIDSDNIYEVTEIQDFNKARCIPEEPALEYLEACMMKMAADKAANETVEAEAINCPQGRKFYTDQSELREEVAKPQSDCKPPFSKDKNALQSESSLKSTELTKNQADRVRSRSASREMSMPRELIPQSKLAEQTGAQPHHKDKSVCKDKSERPKGEINSQLIGQTPSQADEIHNYKENNEPPRHKGEIERTSQFIGDATSQLDQKRKKIICKDKSQAQKPKEEIDSRAQIEEQSNKSIGRDKNEPPKSRGGTDARGKPVCKDKGLGPKPNGDRSPKTYASRENAGQQDKKSKIVCKDGKPVSSTSLRKADMEAKSSTSAKSEPSKSSFFDVLGRSNNNAYDKSKELGKSQDRNKPSTSSKKKNGRATGMTREQKILYGTAAIAILLVLGGLGLYYMNMLEYD